MKRWLLLLPLLILPLFGQAQMFMTTFWQQVAGAVTLGSFSITGVTGATDATADAWLVNDTDPIVNYGSSSSATAYDVVIKDSADTTTVCSVLNTTSTSLTVASCSLTNGSIYHVHVTAKSGSTTRSASNDGISFTVDRTTPTANAITGLTGGTDSTADVWLVGGLVPTVNWTAFTGATSYDVTIKDSAGSSPVCTTQNTTAVSYNFSSCNLSNGTSYKAYVKAKSASGFNTTNASNDGFSFSVDNTAPGTFSITGITGGTDSTIDAYLANGTSPTVNFGSSSNVYRYDVVIKDSAGSTTVCSALNQTTSPVAVSCTLTNGQTYKTYVQAKSISTYLTTNSSNDGYSFTVGSPPSSSPANFSITGATGGTDTTADNWLTNGTTVTANWQSAAGAQNYSVTIRNSGDTADVCATQTTTSTSYTFTGCTLAVGTVYLIKVTANNPPSAATAAVNTGYAFQVITPGPGAFTISGASSGSDTTADDYLMAGASATSMTATWTAAAGASSYDIVIRDANDTVNICGALQNVAATTASFTGCTFTAGTSYLIKVTAKNATVSTPATNSPFVFLVPGTYNMCSAPTATTLKAGFIYDSGGPSGNYAVSESCNYSVNPPATATSMIVNFTSVASNDNGDILNLYDSDSTGAAVGTRLIQIKNTTVVPADQTGTSGKLYLTWASNNSGVAAGFALNYRSIYDLASAPTISGVTGGADTTADTYLTDNSSGVTVSWSAASGAASYDVVIRDTTNSYDICSKANTTSLSYNFSSCTLNRGASYSALVYARNNNGVVNAASNNPFVFTYDTRPTPPLITGLTGGSDTTADPDLETTLNPTVNWVASLNVTSYDVVIYESDGVTVKCPRTNVAAPATSYNFSTCTLSLNSSYVAEVLAKNSNGSKAATNSPYSFNVKSQVWKTLSSTAAPVGGRQQHTAIWTGSEMIVWGGYKPSATYYNTGGRYNPTSDSWIPTSTGANVPAGRYVHTAIWTGSEMIVWGGYTGVALNTGGRYNPAADSWIATSTGANVPIARTDHVAVWTGSEMIIWGGVNDTVNVSSYMTSGGRYNPTTDTWANSPGLMFLEPRSGHTAVWTGSEMIIWGGSSGNSPFYNTGGRYNPTTDSWTPTSMAANCPSVRAGHSAVWTGSEMIIWGGIQYTSYYNSGGRYNPSSDSWQLTSMTANLPAARSGHTAVWTGTEMIIWGGTAGSSTYFNTGGRYNPTTDSWLATSAGSNLPAARTGHTALWTGSEMIVWGGNAGSATYYNTGGRYNPSTDSWLATGVGTNVPTTRTAHTAIWTGTEMIVWGGNAGSTTYYNTGGRYNPSTDTWLLTGTGSNVPGARSAHTAIWTNSEMIIWGGSTSTTTEVSTGGRYNPTTDSWTATSVGTNLPSSRYQHTAIWTGSEMIIWGGYSNSVPSLDSGGRYNPSANTWSATGTIANLPGGRRNFTGVWTGSEMIVWGGYNYPTAPNNYWKTGGRYNPTSDHWLPTSTGANTPTARNFHTAIWTGSEMIIWGGGDMFTVNSGGRYNPATDTWIPTSGGTNVPTARQKHTAVWTGTEMIVWGGSTNTGGRYNPTTDSWSVTSLNPSVPSARSSHTAVWTGSGMLIWGGYDGTNYLNDGASFNP